MPIAGTWSAKSLTKIRKSIVAPTLIPVELHHSLLPKMKNSHSPELSLIFPLSLNPLQQLTVYATPLKFGNSSTKLLFLPSFFLSSMYVCRQAFMFCICPVRQILAKPTQRQPGKSTPPEVWSEAELEKFTDIIMSTSPLNFSGRRQKVRHFALIFDTVVFNQLWF